MTELAYSLDVSTASLVSIFAGLLALYVFVKSGGNQESGNRHCPQARRGGASVVQRRRP